MEMEMNVKNPAQKDIDWIKENILAKLVKDKTIWKMPKEGISIEFNKIDKAFKPMELSDWAGSTYEYTKAILEKLGWAEAKTDFLFVHCAFAQE